MAKLSTFLNLLILSTALFAIVSCSESTAEEDGKTVGEDINGQECQGQEDTDGNEDNWKFGDEQKPSRCSERNVGKDGKTNGVDKQGCKGQEVSQDKEDNGKVGDENQQMTSGCSERAAGKDGKTNAVDKQGCKGQEVSQGERNNGDVKTKFPFGCGSAVNENQKEFPDFSLPLPVRELVTALTNVGKKIGEGLKKGAASERSSQGVLGKKGDAQLDIPCEGAKEKVKGKGKGKGKSCDNEDN